MNDISLYAHKMTSLEIAKLTGKRHAHVLRDIDKMFKELEIDWTQFWAEYTDDSGKANTMYALDKRLSLVLATWYSILWRTKIIDRWEELELWKIQKPRSLEETVKETVLLLDRRIHELEEKIAIDAPKVHFAEVISSSTWSILIREFAKIIYEKWIDMGEKKIYSWLRDNRYVSSRNEPYQQYMTQWLFEVRESVAHTIFWDRINKTTLLTWKGQIYFFDKLSKIEKKI